MCIRDSFMAGGISDKLYQIEISQEELDLVMNSSVNGELIVNRHMNLEPRDVYKRQVYKGMELYVADADTELVKGATDCDKIGKTFHDLGLPTDIKESDKPTVRQISVNDSGCRCVIRRGDKYIVAVTIDKSFYTVSYTHLDVYKRQAGSRVERRFCRYFTFIYGI